MLAAHQGHVDIVRILLSHGASLEQRDADGDTALHYACFGEGVRVRVCLNCTCTGLTKILSIDCICVKIECLSEIL
jgi:hypothetical protein